MNQRGNARCGRSSSLGSNRFGAKLIQVVALLLSLALVLIAGCSDKKPEKHSLADETGQLSMSQRSEIGIGDLHAVVVGVSDYSHPKVPKLRFSEKDARDVAEFLKEQARLFRTAYVTLLCNAQATKREVERQLYYELRRAGKDDTVIVFLSGHGADDPNTPGEFFFLTYDADPEFLAATAVHMNRQWFLNKLDSKRIVLIADACHAGGFSPNGVKSMAPSFRHFMEQFRDSEGRVLITSSRADEVSRERASLGNGIFTHYLIEGLNGGAADKDGIVTVKALYDFVYRKTKDASGGRQHPQMEGRIVGEFPISVTNINITINFGSEPPRPPKPVKRPETKPQENEPTKPTTPSDETAASTESVYLRCIGSIRGWHWLKGDTKRGTLSIVPSPGEAGTLWTIHVRGETVQVECSDTSGDLIWLRGDCFKQHVVDGTPRGTVSLSRSDGASDWRIRRLTYPQAKSECRDLLPVHTKVVFKLSTLDSSLLSIWLNGHSAPRDGSVNLAPPNHSGTYWALVSP